MSTKVENRTKVDFITLMSHLYLIVSLTLTALMFVLLMELFLEWLGSVLFMFLKSQH